MADPTLVVDCESSPTQAMPWADPTAASQAESVAQPASEDIDIVIEDADDTERTPRH